MCSAEVLHPGCCTPPAPDRRYILVYPQGCDVCNHLSLFLCVADYDKLLPGGWATEGTDLGAGPATPVACLYLS